MIRLPPHPRGLRIGLFGGTFDPPHAAHRAVCLIAMQRLNLEWFYRLCTEPKRLWKRYAKYNPAFVIGFLRQYLRAR